MKQSEINKLDDKLLIHATLGDLVRVIRYSLALDQLPQLPEKRYVYGLQGLADLLGCSKVTASRIKSSGALDSAISQNGRVIIIDADLALELMNINKRHRNLRGGYNIKK